MAFPVSHNRNTNAIVWAAVIAIAVLLALFLIGGGRNSGQPSAPSGPSNPMQSDQGR